MHWTMSAKFCHAGAKGVYALDLLATGAGVADRDMALALDIDHLAPVLGGVLAGGLLQGFSGFGFAIAAVPLIGLFMPPAVALPYAMMLQAVLGLAGLPSCVGLCRWRLLAWLALGMAVGTPIGVWAITTLPPALGRLMLGLAVLVAFTVVFLGRRLAAHVNARSTVAAGLVAGVMNGLAGMAGPPAVALVMSSDATAAERRATLLIFVFAAALAALVPLGAAGRITADMTLPVLFAVPALGAGWAGGAFLFCRTSTKAHHMVALIAIGFLAVATLLRAGFELAAHR